VDEHTANAKGATFGARLKRERERRSISLDEVSAATKISLRMLRALEEEKFEQLPGGIFNKGFVRAYARHLGIDEEQAVADYLEAAGENAPKAQEAVVESPDAKVSEGSHDGPANVPWGAVAIVLLLIALGLSLWSFYARQANRRSQETPVPQPQPTSSSPTSSAPNFTSATVSDSTATPSSTQGSASSSTGLDANGKGHPPNELNPGTQPRNGPGNVGSLASPANGIKNLSLLMPDTNPVSNTVKQPAATASSFIVLIEAEENSWVSIVADGKVILEGTLIAPAVKSIRARKQITIKAGNVGGLGFSFNGNKLPPQGGSGEVKNLIFGAGGLEAPAPKPPS
jgi:cytoskeleton protein RodZ